MARRRKPARANQGRDQASRNLTAPLCFLLAMMTFVVYSRALNNPFVNYDDPAYVTKNLHVQQGLTQDTVGWALASIEYENWHPVTWLSHALDCQLFGLDPAGHHFTSVLIHVLNVVILFWLLTRVTGATGRSFMVAALFALHPVNVESVAWIAERKNVLSMFFFLVTLGAYGWYAMRPRIPRYVAVTGLFALGLMAKPQLVTLPFVLLLLDFWPLQRVEGRPPSPNFPVPQLSFWRLGREKVPLLFLSSASCIVTIVAQRRVVAPIQHLPLCPRLINTAYSYVAYVGQAFWPVHLAVFYPYEGDRISRAAFVLCLLFLATLSLFIWCCRKHLYLPIGWLWFLGTLFPMIGLLQVSTQAMADRYFYLPGVGIFVIVVWGAADLSSRFQFNLRWLAAVAIAILSVLTWRQIGVWSSEYELWSHALKTTRDNQLAEYYVGKALFWPPSDSGKTLEQSRNESFEHFRNAIRINPSDAPSHLLLAAALQWRGETQEATKRYPEAQWRGELREAVEQYRMALALPPRWQSLSLTYREDLIWAMTNLGSAYHHLGDCENADRYYRKVLRIDPQDRLIAFNLDMLEKFKNAGECR